ncbi:MAG TPA: SAM-dependent methyltransferase [Bryobacteraceae bacterium]|nr:SAM-dependent methyltransferase [Bryobacteraceae bacterium]
MTPIGEMLRDEVMRSGPVRFSRFMEAALYEPEHGYYRRPRDPFGRSGDFFTAEQIQPVFGRLVAQLFRRLGGGRTVVELGAGRRDMAPAFAAFEYVALDVDVGVLPARFEGFAFANEFFDALPVDVVAMRDGVLRQVRVGWTGERFAWVLGEGADEKTATFVEDAVGPLAEGSRMEVSLRSYDWIDRIGAALAHGFALIVDYGYEPREAMRFPTGTLMSYRRHHADEDVLAEPGDRDITAHVAFGALEAQARRRGLEVVCTESMAATLIRVGEADQFMSALAAADDTEALRLRMQLKTLLFGMGEAFRTLLLRR